MRKHHHHNAQISIFYINIGCDDYGDDDNWRFSCYFPLPKQQAETEEHINETKKRNCVSCAWTFLCAYASLIVNVHQMLQKETFYWHKYKKCHIYNLSVLFKCSHFVWSFLLPIFSFSFAVFVSWISMPQGRKNIFLFLQKQHSYAQVKKHPFRNHFQHIIILTNAYCTLLDHKNEIKKWNEIKCCVRFIHINACTMRMHRRRNKKKQKKKIQHHQALGNRKQRKWKFANRIYMCCGRKMFIQKGRYICFDTFDMLFFVLSFFHFFLSHHFFSFGRFFLVLFILFW